MNQETESPAERIRVNSLKYFNRLNELNQSSSPILRSYYLCKQAIYETRNKVESIGITSKAPTRCNHCCMKFSDSPSKYFVESGMKKLSFHRKLLSKQINGRDLTNFQSEYLKNMDKLLNNKLEIVCGFCDHKRSIILDKTKKLQGVKLVPSEESIQTPKKRNLLRNIDTYLTPKSIINDSNINNQSERSKKKKKRKKSQLDASYCSTLSNLTLLTTKAVSIKGASETITSSSKKSKMDKFCTPKKDAVLSKNVNVSSAVPLNNTPNGTPGSGLVSVNSSKKKKKKKDKFCGLQKDAVLSANLNSSYSTSNFISLEKSANLSSENNKHNSLNGSEINTLSKRLIKEQKNKLIKGTGKESNQQIEKNQESLIRNMGISKIKKAKNKKAIKSKLNVMLNTKSDNSSSPSIQQLLKCS